MAHINTTGVHIPLWFDAPDTAIGWGQSPFYPTQEGTFFGQLFVTNTSNNLDAYYCNGGGVTSDVVPGRLGSSQNSASAPYANAYPTSGGLCSTSGHCQMQTSNDGAVSCTGNGKTWKHPISVWRGQTFQAENATLGGPAGVITDQFASGGKRVGYIYSGGSVTFHGVRAAAAGSNNLVVYYTNGDPVSPAYSPRYFNVSVNGGALQNRVFNSTGSWTSTGQVIIPLTGFNAGSTNTIQFSGDGKNNTPDLDWIEVVANTAP
jgi:hypothetical protein